jgi:hypothetical protein
MLNNINNKAFITVVAALMLVGNGLVYAQEDEHKELCEVERDRDMQLQLSTNSGLPGSEVNASMSVTLIEGDRPRGWRDAGFIWVDSSGNPVSDWVIVDVVDGEGIRFADYVREWSVPAGETLTGYATATLTVPAVPPGTNLQVWVCVGHPHGPGDYHWLDFTVDSFMVVPESILGGIGILGSVLAGMLLYRRL